MKRRSSPFTAFCQRMLNDYAFESGTRFDTALVTDPKPLFQEIARDFWRLRFYRAKPLLPTLAMAWKKSPDNWVELLERTRSHPDLVVLPPAEAKSCEELLHGVELAFAAVKEEWKSHRAEIEKLLREHGGLSRAKDNFSPTRVTELIATVDEACEQFEFAAPESIGVFSEICSEAIAAGTKPTGTAPVHPFFALSTEFCRAVGALFNQLTHEFLEFAQAELPKRKAQTNTVTYDDLITGLRDALRQKEASSGSSHRRKVLHGVDRRVSGHRSSAIRDLSNHLPFQGSSPFFHRRSETSHLWIPRGGCVHLLRSGQDSRPKVYAGHELALGRAAARSG